MPVSQVFQVATSFNFEIGSALLGAEKLKKSVDSLSGSIENAQVQFKSFGMSAALSLAGAGGGIFGFFMKTVNAADKLHSTQIKISTAIASSMSPGAFTFQERMEKSHELMEKMAKIAKKFSLPEQDMIGTSTNLALLLGQKGLAGDDWSVAMDMARSFLKSAPTLGVEPDQAQGQLIRMLEGGASMGDTLFRRLASETTPMKEFLNQTQKFNKLDPAKRVDILRRALGQFSNQANEVNERTKTLASTLNDINNTMFGTLGIFRDLGTLLRDSLVRVLRSSEGIIDNQGRRITKILTGIMRPYITDLERSYILAQQLRGAGSDLNRTKNIIEVMGAVKVFGELLKWFNITSVITSAKIIELAGGIFFLGSVLNRAKAPFFSIGGIIGKIATGLGSFLVINKILKIIGVGTITFSHILTGLSFALRRILLPITFFFAALQVVQRSVAMAQIKDAKALPEVMARFAESAQTLHAIYRVVTNGIYAMVDRLAESMSWLFMQSKLLDYLASALNTTGNALLKFIAAIYAVFEGINGAIGYALGGGDWLKGGGKGMLEGWRKVMGEYEGEKDKMNKPITSKQVTNIGKVEIKNQFKENLEPDRIAFTIKEHLLRAARNPTQATGRSYSRASVLGA